MKTGRQVIAATRRSINARVERRSPGGTKKAFKDTLRANHTDAEIDNMLHTAGIDAIRNATVEDLDRLVYGIAWVRAYRKPLSQFYSEFHA